MLKLACMHYYYRAYLTSVSQLYILLLQSSNEGYSCFEKETSVSLCICAYMHARVCVCVCVCVRACVRACVRVCVES